MRFSQTLMAASLMAASTLAAIAEPSLAREAVDASPPEKLSVTIYRDPNRGVGEDMKTGSPQGFAMISEERVVTLPPGESTIRFDGVAEGMVAVSAIVTGLPGGTIEKNRNADLLSPAALVDGTLGNRVTITRTNPATGVSTPESAIIRTRADGGLVLQTSAGYEAVRCAGLPEKLTFDRVPSGLSAKPVFSIDTQDATGGTYRVVLTYLAWGFDWQANYVATFDDSAGERRRGSRDPEKVKLRLTSWLTLLNDNGQSFEDAELMAVAGTINIVSDFEDLAEPPTGEPLRLRCYPIGSTAAGSPVPFYGNIPPPPPPPAMAPAGLYAEGDAIIVTGSRMRRSALQETPVAITAAEEQLGDLKLYRVPEPVTVAAKGQKQIAFLQRNNVTARMLYVGNCEAFDAVYEDSDDFDPARILLSTVNDEKNGLGVALPQGGLTLFEQGPSGTMLVAEQDLRDYANGQDVELELSESSQVFTSCGFRGDNDPDDNGRKWTPMRARATNANPFPITVRFDLGWASDWQVRGLRGTRVKDGKRIWEVTIPANSARDYKWRVRLPEEVDEDD